jgi:hypothetical protein
MDHHYIASHQIVELYVSGRLADDQSAAFEEHLIECRECQEDVSLANDLKLGLEDAAAAGEWKRSAERGLAAWLRQAFASPAPAWALAGVLITLLPAWLLLRSLDQRNVQLSAEMAELRNRPAPPSPPSAAGVPVLSLSLSRGVGRGKEPVPQVRVDPGQTAIVLALEYIHDPAVKSYRATLERADHTLLAAIDSLSPMSTDTIGVQVQSRVLSPGRYSVALTGVNASGRAAPLGRFEFEVVP